MEPTRAKARGFKKSGILERPSSIPAINGAVLWPRKYKNLGVDESERGGKIKNEQALSLELIMEISW